MSGSRIRSVVGMVGLTGALLLVAITPGAAGAPPRVDCSKQDFQSLELQDNMRAGEILVQCGRAPGGSSFGAGTSAGARALGGTDINLITGAQSFPNGVTQSENMVWAQGNTVAVTYNDSRGASGSPANYSGISVSTDSGATFARLNPSPFTGHGDNFGDPVIVFNQKLGMWYAGFLASAGDCGLQGIGMWQSSDALTWTTAPCASVGIADDREAMTVDNNPTSPFFGRMYLIWNDFALPGANIVESHSDNGTSWTIPKIVSSGSFTRVMNLQVAPDGTVLAHGNRTPTQGGPKDHVLYRSTNGGATFTTAITMAGGQAAPGVTGGGPCSGRQNIPPIWRYEGAGQLGAGPNGVVNYAYTRGDGADQGNIYLVRSTNNGTTWSAPLKLNVDAGTRAQWMPSLTATPSGQLLASWYDRRNTANFDYERFARISTDNGATWGSEFTLGDTVITQPAQASPQVQACYAGDYDAGYSTQAVSYAAWTDGRVPISGTPQQDVFLDKVSYLPTAVTGAASGITASTAKVAGTANDTGQAGSVAFEFGKTASYGKTTPIVSIPASTADQPVTQTLSGLAPGTLYHFRLVVTNAAGSTAGADATLKTKTVKCGGKKATIAGTNGKDNLKGTNKKDVIAGLGGNDKIKGKGGKDTLCGGSGKDTLNGGGAKDKLLGQGGKDKMKGGGGRDTCKGGGKTDTATGCEKTTGIP
jgi:Ca2+-binding RTX toxin-like protein